MRLQGCVHRETAEGQEKFREVSQECQTQSLKMRGMLKIHVKSTT